MGTVTNKGGLRMVGAQGNGKAETAISPRKAMAGANVKGGPAKVGYKNGGCVRTVRGTSRVVGGGK
jgi:hypothetical protein